MDLFRTCYFFVYTQSVRDVSCSEQLAIQSSVDILYPSEIQNGYLKKYIYLNSPSCHPRVCAAKSNSDTEILRGLCKMGFQRETR